MILHLSLERINGEETPYQVEPTEQNGFLSILYKWWCALFCRLYGR